MIFSCRINCLLIRGLACIIAVRTSSCRRVMERDGVVCETENQGSLAYTVFAVGMSVADWNGQRAKGIADDCEIGGAAR